MEIQFKQNGIGTWPIAVRVGNNKPAVNPDEAVTRGQLEVAGTGVAITLANVGAFTGSITHSGTETFSGAIVSSATTESTSSTTGAIKTAGGLGVAKNLQVAGQLVANKNIVQNHTPFTAGTDTTAGWTLANVTTGLIAGAIKTTSAAAVTLILDSVANIVTAFATAGVTIGTGTILQFIVDNTAGANTVTVQVDGGATIAVATPVITGGATLTLSTANKVGVFQLYLSSPTAAILSRLV